MKTVQYSAGGVHDIRSGRKEGAEQLQVSAVSANRRDGLEHCTVSASQPAGPSDDT